MPAPLEASRGAFWCGAVRIWPPWKGGCHFALQNDGGFWQCDAKRSFPCLRRPDFFCMPKRNRGKKTAAGGGLFTRRPPPAPLPPDPSVCPASHLGGVYTTAAPAGCASSALHFGLKPQIPSVTALPCQLPLKLQGEPSFCGAVRKASSSGEGEVPNGSEAEGMGSTRTAGSCRGHPYPQIPSVALERGSSSYLQEGPLGRGAFIFVQMLVPMDFLWYSIKKHKEAME